MENNDLAIILPHLGQDALYRVLSSLTLQSDRRFTVYGFCLRGETAVKALFEDYAEPLDLFVCEVDAFPALDAPLPELARFFLAPLAGERFVTFSDGEAIYDRDCVQAFHERSGQYGTADLLRWNRSCLAPRLRTFRSFCRRHLLGEKPLPVSQLIVRRQSLERLLSESSFFSYRQLLAELARGGMARVHARVTPPPPQETITP